MSFLDDYEPVEDRIRAFWDDHPDGKILTELVYHDTKQFVCKAFVFKAAPNPVDITTAGELRVDRTAPDATGYAQEVVGSSKVNETSALENCETSAIGRALANLGYAAKGKRPSREEMSKVGRQSQAPQSEGTDHPSPPAGAQCPSCGSEVYDNWADVYASGSNGPLWKCKNKDCQGGGAKKNGSGNWPWASWNEDEFTGGPDPVREDFPTPELVVVPDAEPFENGNPDEAPF